MTSQYFFSTIKQHSFEQKRGKMKLFFSDFRQLVSEKYRPGEPRYFLKAFNTCTAFGTRRCCQKVYPVIKEVVPLFHERKIKIQRD